MAKMENPGALGGATGAAKPIQATADSPQTIPHGKTKCHKAGTRYAVTTSTGDVFRIGVSGRNRWALEKLRRAGGKGCTPILNPAPRWSAYVFNLREMGVEIDTIIEPHGGEYAGHHALYVLRSTIVAERKGGAL